MLYIVGGKILTMAGDVWEKGYLGIENGKIKELGPMKDGAPFPLPDNAEVINALGYLVMPGLIAVYYKHLRAPETRHERVCGLLV